MARQARIKSESGIYHIMLRGINKQKIFFDESDYKHFIKILIDCKRISKFNLYAYCLMDNHIHLLMKENDENISTIMKRIGCRFVYWYNAKYQRTGHLFQDRYKSEPVETDEYFLCALRYIHQNPVAAKIVAKCSDYEYSSYNWYYENGILVDKEKLLSMMRMEQFAAFHLQKERRDFLEITEKNPVLTDDRAEAIIKETAAVKDIKKIPELEKENQVLLIGQLKRKGLSIRQITMFTGLTKRQVEKVKIGSEK